jgi:hypothetical protein
MRFFSFDEPQILYYGHADLLAQIGHELASSPDSCFSKNVISWYNALYSAGDTNFVDCSYQIEQQSPSSLEDVIDVISSFVQGKNRRLARASIRIICRESQRLLTESNAPSI